MSEQTAQDWREIPNDIHKKYAEFYRLLGGSSLVAILLVIGAFIFIDQVTDFSMNVFTEVISVTGTVFILDRLNRNRAYTQRKKDLIAQFGSQSNEFALEALRLIKTEGWDKDGSLKGANLRESNLENANLKDFNLQNVNFRKCKLIKANLAGSNLRHADLSVAKMQNADFFGANLESVNFMNANLEGAHLEKANLKNANLKYVSNLDKARFDESTILPDGSNWSPDKMEYLIAVTKGEME